MLPSSSIAEFRPDPEGRYRHFTPEEVEWLGEDYSERRRGTPHLSS